MEISFLTHSTKIFWFIHHLHHISHFGSMLPKVENELEPYELLYLGVNHGAEENDF